MAGIFSRLLGRGDAEPKFLDIGELQRSLNSGDVLLVDVRQPEEFRAPPGHLPGAINVPLGEIAAHAAELTARKQPIVVVCQTDRRSARAAGELLAAGLRDVAVLRGGTAGWHAQGLPLE